MKTNFTEQDLRFYPTPKSLLNRITDSLKWNKITSVLEPSAGKGDIADYVKEKLNTPYTRYSNTTKISTSSYYNTFNVNLLHDLEKVFNYLGGTPQTSWDSYDTMRYVEKSEQIKNVRFRYFTVNFFKKGTAHITFTDENLDTLKKFNIFGSQQKGWLPPSYGKKKYQDMTQEEKSVINEFQGEDDYRYILEHADQFIYDPKSSVPLLTQLS